MNEMESMEIETKNASLDTMAVTIQALHVSGKQMTLAVFRQLPSSRAYNEDGSLAPMEYWGVVRYTIKDESDVWVVCASGGRLYRCPFRWYGDSVYRCEGYLRDAKACLAWWHAYKAMQDSGKWHSVHTPRGCRAWRDDDIGLYEDDVMNCSESLENSRRAEVTYQFLSGLPQLFIAV